MATTVRAPEGGAIDWAAIGPTEILPGISRQRIDGQHATIIRYVYQPAAVFPTHSHPEEQTTVVLSGRIEFWLGDRRVTVGPGETLLVPAGVAHGARVVGAEPVETINVMAPIRQGDLRYVNSRLGGDILDVRD